MKLEDILEGSPENMRKALQEWLGSEISISDQVLAALVVSPRYAERLSSLRDYPDAINHLLTHPPEVSVSVLEGLDEEQKGNVELVGKAAKSLGRWMVDGFRSVDEETRNRRWEACMACPHIEQAPTKMIYKISSAASKEKKFCRLCGCNVRIKGRLPHESCPATHPINLAQTRWGEPVKK